MSAAETTRRRVQLSRRAGWRMPADAVKIDRTTEWGNPFLVKSIANMETGGKEWWVEHASSVWMFATKAEAQAAAVKLYRAWLDHPEHAGLRDRVKLMFERRRPACWCPLDHPCHGDVLLEIANGEVRL